MKKKSSSDAIAPNARIAGAPTISAIDLIGYAFQYLPTYTLFGNLGARLVCKPWRNLIDQKSQGKKTRQAILQSIKHDCNNLDEALIILSDDAILFHLTFEDRLKIIAKHTEILEHIFSHRKLRLFPLLDGPTQMAMLGKYHETFARRIYLHPEFRVNVPNPPINWLHAENLLVNHPDFAKEILTEPHNRQFVRHFDLIKPCKKNIALAWHYICEPSILATLRGYPLGTLGSYHSEIAVQIFNTPQLRAKLNLSYDPPNGLAVMASKNPSLTETVCDDPEIIGQFSGFELSYMGCYLPSIAQKIFDRKDLNTKLDGANLVKMGHKKIAIAQLIKERPELFNRLNNGQKAELCQCHFVMAQSLLDTPDIIDKFDLLSILKLGSVLPPIALRILKTPKLSDQLESWALVRLSEQFPSIIQYIFSNQTLYSRLKLNDKRYLEERLDRATMITTFALELKAKRNPQPEPEKRSYFGCSIG